jgi:hypothetical protein
MNDIDILLNIIQTSETTLKDIALSLDGDRCISQPMEDNSSNYHKFDLNPDRFIWYDNNMTNCRLSWDALKENKLDVYRSLAGRSNLLSFVKSLNRDLHYPMGAPLANFTGITHFQTRITEFDETDSDELDLDAELDHYYWLLKNTRFDKLTSIRLMTHSAGWSVTFIWHHPLRMLCHELGISLCYHEESRWDSEPIPFTSVELSLL